MRMHALVVIVVVTLFLALATAAVGADDPRAGTWKLNLAKSSQDPPGQPLKSRILRIEIKGNVLTAVNDYVYADGTSRHTQETVVVDGKRHPKEGDPNADSYVSTRTDANTIQTTYYKQAVEMSSRRSVVSDDGRTLRLTGKGKDAQGREFNNLLVFEKQ